MSPSASTCIVNPDVIMKGMEIQVDILQAYYIHVSGNLLPVMSVILITVSLCRCCKCQLVLVSERRTKSMFGKTTFRPTHSYLMLPATLSSSLSEPCGSSTINFPEERKYSLTLRLRNWN
jgi:hypothetical protein